MQPREKLLATALAVVAAVFVLRPVLDGLIVQPLRDRDATITSSTEIVRALEDRAFELQKATRSLITYRQHSLPPKPHDAQREYSEWLMDLALLSNWRDPKVTLGTRTPRGAAATIPVTIKAQATLDDVNRFLERWESTALLQRVVDLQLDSPSFSGNPLLDVELTAEGVAVADAAPRTRLFPTAELAGPVDADDATLFVTHAEEFPTATPFVARLDNELIAVERVAANQWTVARGALGSRASEHGAQTPVELTPQQAGPVGAPSRTLPAVQRLFVRAAESGTLQLTAELTPAVRGRAWTAPLQLLNWDVAQGQPRFQLADGAPVGMTLDPRDGMLSWTPPEEFALGPLDVRVAVLGRDSQSPVIETALKIDVRRPNNPPQLATPETVDVWLGRPWEFAVPAVDPDLPNDTLTYEVAGNVPDGLTIDSSTGVLNWSPPAEADLGEFQLEVTVTDAGQPVESDRRTLTLRLTDDNAVYTFFVGSVVHNGVREGWLYDRSTNQRTVVHEGEEFRIADLTGKVTRIGEDAMDIESDEQVYRLRLGQNLRGWTQTQGSSRPVNTDEQKGSSESRGT